MDHLPEMRAVIIDDEPLARSELVRLCRQRDDVNVVAEAASGASGIEAIRMYRPELLLLEVELHDMTGFDLLRSPQVHHDLLAILISGTAAHALHAFEHQAVDFLTKPVRPERFGNAIDRAQRLASARRVVDPPRGLKQAGAMLYSSTPARELMLIAERANRYYFLLAADIEYIQADGNYLMMHVGKECYLSRNTLKNLYAGLSQIGFMRIDRSTLINLRQVAFAERLRHFKEIAFTLRSGARVLSGKTHRKAILQQLRRSMHWMPAAAHSRIL